MKRSRSMANASPITRSGRRTARVRGRPCSMAVARDLAARGVTTPGRLAALGGSNGGLLVGNMLTRYPELFGAIWCTVPLLDMRRYTKLLGRGKLDRGVRRPRP